MRTHEDILDRLRAQGVAIGPPLGRFERRAWERGTGVDLPADLTRLLERGTPRVDLLPDWSRPDRFHIARERLARDITEALHARWPTALGRPPDDIARWVHDTLRHHPILPLGTGPARRTIDRFVPLDSETFAGPVLGHWSHGEFTVCAHHPWSAMTGLASPYGELPIDPPADTETLGWALASWLVPWRHLLFDEPTTPLPDGLFVAAERSLYPADMVVLGLPVDDTVVGVPLSILMGHRVMLRGARCLSWSPSTGLAVAYRDPQRPPEPLEVECLGFDAFRSHLARSDAPRWLPVERMTYAGLTDVPHALVVTPRAFPDTACSTARRTAWGALGQIETTCLLAGRDGIVRKVYPLAAMCRLRPGDDIDALDGEPVELRFDPATERARVLDGRGRSLNVGFVGRDAARRLGVVEWFDA